MSGENGVVGFNNRVGHRWRGVYRELELGLLAIVGREALEDKGTETGTSSTAKGVENEKALETTAVVCKAADLLHYSVNHFLAHSVVTTGVYSMVSLIDFVAPKAITYSCSQHPPCQ